MNERMSARERFEFSTIPEPNSGCHLWLGAEIGTMGHGQLRVRSRQKMYAHRYAWERANGPVPEGLDVLHRCDVPACVNPDHLFLGTRIDNNRDRDLKGRTARGESHGRTRARRNAAKPVSIEAPAVTTGFRRRGKWHQQLGPR